MKLNLGCGADLRAGFVNVDVRPAPGVFECDLAKMPWPWQDDSVEEILLFDFLEHLPWNKTVPVIQECWRVLKEGAVLKIQVPDLDHCAHAALDEPPYMCNRCGFLFEKSMTNREKCLRCSASLAEIQDEAIHRLYGGQKVQQDFHCTAFTLQILGRMLKENGFENIESVEHNQNGETLRQNWNILVTSTKGGDCWQI